VVRKIVGDFGNEDFWKNRRASGEKIRVAINEKLKDTYAECTNIQLINVQLSQKREQSLINTQVTKQQGKTKTKEQQAKEIRSNITVAASRADKQITQIKGGADAQAKLILASANANATNMTISATADAYKYLGTQISVTPQSGLDKFVYYSELQTADSPVFLSNPTTVLFYLNK